MTNRVVATKVADIYLTHWAKRIGRPATDRDLALIWHHGPNGWKRSGGVYWKRVRDRVVAGKVRDRVLLGRDRVVAAK
jgi:hypothetical protein